MSSPHKAYLWLVQRTIGFEFYAVDLPVDLDKQQKSTACNHLRNLGILEVVGKDGQAYLYRYVSPVPPDHEWRAYSSHSPSAALTGRPHRNRTFRLADFLPTETTVRDERMGIEHTTRYGTKHLPEEQSVPADRIAHNFQEQAGAMRDVDYSGVEARILAQMSDLAKQLPVELNKLGKALQLARLSLLEGFTDIELLNELSRRGRRRQ